MVRKLAITAVVLAGSVFAQESSSPGGFLDLPDTLSQELQQVAESGFWEGFKLSSIVMLATGSVAIVIHLINRAAGR
jgi:hypothetical protein